MRAAPIVKPPPVAERPRCPYCAEPLRPVMHTEYATELRPEKVYRFKQGQTVVEEDHSRMSRVVTGAVSRGWTGGYLGYGAFCTLRCCEAYANRMFEKHGTRFTKR